MDETGFLINNEAGKKGAKYVHSLISFEKGENIKIICNNSLL